MSAEVAVVREAYKFFTEEHFFEESEIDFLLKFQNPLELISDKWGNQLKDVSHTIRGIFGDQERELQRGGYELASEETAPELRRKTNEKLSVLAQIRQAEKEAKERLAPPIEKPLRGRSEATL